MLHACGAIPGPRRLGPSRRTPRVRRTAVRSLLQATVAAAGLRHAAARRGVAPSRVGVRPAARPSAAAGEAAGWLPAWRAGFREPAAAGQATRGMMPRRCVHTARPSVERRGFPHLTIRASRQRRRRGRRGRKAPRGSRGARRSETAATGPTFPGAMRCGCEPARRVSSRGMEDGMVFVPGVPGFPPGASRVRYKKPPGPSV